MYNCYLKRITATVIATNLSILLIDINKKFTLIDDVHKLKKSNVLCVNTKSVSVFVVVL